MLKHRIFTAILLATTMILLPATTPAAASAPPAGSMTSVGVDLIYGRDAVSAMPVYRSLSG